MNSKAIHFLLPVLLNAALALLLSSTASAFNAAHMELLKTGVTSWNKMRAAHQEFTPDLSGAELKGKNLRGIDFHNANLSNSVLSMSDLSNANLQNASLDSARMDGSILFRANLEGAILQKADLESAQLDGANLHRADIQTAVLKKADCSNANMTESDLRECNLREATLVNADLSGADLRAAYLWRANLSRAKITGVKVSENTVLDSGKYASGLWAKNHQSLFIEEPEASIAANPVSSVTPEKEVQQDVLPRQSDAPQLAQPVTGSTMPQSDAATSKKSLIFRNIWQHADGPINAAYDRQQYKQLKSNVFDWNTMRKHNRAIIVKLNGASFDHKNLSYADLSHASLPDASLKGTDLSESDLRSADLRGCNLREANLQSADLGGADLRGANLWRANLSRARLTGAVVSSLTVLDSGKKATPELAARYELTFAEQ
jgi:uncharacterized protein YjbI with pentapeptide repeats